MSGRLSGEAVGDLFLQHDGEAARFARLLQQMAEDGGAGGIGEVGDDVERLAGREQLVGGERQGIARHQLEPGDIAERGLQMRDQRAIELDGDDAARLAQQLRGENPQTGTDLQHGVALGDTGLTDHALDQPALEEKVLPEPLVGPDAELAHEPHPVPARGRDAGGGVDGRKVEEISSRRGFAHGETSMPAPWTTWPMRHSGMPAPVNAVSKASAWPASTAKRRPPEVCGS